MKFWRKHRNCRSEDDDATGSYDTYIKFYKNQKNVIFELSLWKRCRDAPQPIMEILFIHIHNLTDRGRLCRSSWFMWHCAVYSTNALIISCILTRKATVPRLRTKAGRKRTLEPVLRALFFLLVNLIRLLSKNSFSLLLDNIFEA